MKRLFFVFASLTVTLVLCPAALAAGPKLQSGDYVAVIGDSITEQRLYSLYIEDYLLMCQPARDLRVTQFGWGGETAPGFASRMANDMLRFSPTVATTCFGMNDGGYSPMDPAKARALSRRPEVDRQAVEEGRRAVHRGRLARLRGRRHVPAASPSRPKMYNKTLAACATSPARSPQEEGVVFANVFDPMIDAMTKAKAKYGREYHVGGGDGVHPDRNGHLVMAYAFLKALGCDGNIGTITVDLAQSKAEASDGHKVLSRARRSRGNREHPLSVLFLRRPGAARRDARRDRVLAVQRGAQPADAVVKGGTAARCKVTWGDATKECPAATGQGHQPGGRVPGQPVL